MLIGFGWSAGWYYVEGRVVETMDASITRFAENNRLVECADRQTYGFPFRIGVTCSAFSYEDLDGNFSLESGGVKSVAQAYQPTRLLVEISDPLALRLPDGQALTVQWDSMRASANAGMDGLSRFSLVGKDLSVLPVYGAGAPATMDRFQLHGRRQNGNDAQVSVSLEDFDSDYTSFPRLDATLSATLNNAYQSLVTRPDIVALAKSEGLSGTFDSLRYAPTGSGSLELNGPFEMDRTGVLSGKFNLTITDGPRVMKTLGEGLPQYREQFEQASQALGLLGKAGSGAVTLPLTVRNGNVSLGIIPIGKIQPLF